MSIKKVTKSFIHQACVSLFNHLSPPLRAKIVRDGVDMSDLYSHLPPRLLIDLCMGSMPRLQNIKSVVITGALGAFEGSPKDRVILPHYARTGTWSPELHSLISNNIFQDGQGTFLDIGANIGLTCVPVASRHRVTCIAFEPDPTNFTFLKNNITRNGVNDLIQPYNLALFDTATELEMELSPDNLGDHRIRSSDVSPSAADAFNESQRRVINIKAARLDDVLINYTLSSPVVAKLDVQGAELHVLRGGTQTLPHIDLLVLEFWPYGLARAGASTDELFEYFARFPLGAILNFDRPHEIPFATTLELNDIESVIATLKGMSLHADHDFHVDIVLARESMLNVFPPRGKG